MVKHLSCLMKVHFFLSYAGKILAKLSVESPNVSLDQMGLIPESQCGFRKIQG